MQSMKMQASNNNSEVNRSIVRFKNKKCYCGKKACVRIFESINNLSKFFYFFIAYQENAVIILSGHQMKKSLKFLMMQTNRKSKKGSNQEVKIPRHNHIKSSLEEKR